MQIDQPFCEYSRAVNVAGSPTDVYPHIAAIGPPQLRKPLREPGEVGFCLRIVFIVGHQSADPPQALALLRPRHYGPRSRAS